MWNSNRLWCQNLPMTGAMKYMIDCINLKKKTLEQSGMISSFFHPSSTHLVCSSFFLVNRPKSALINFLADIYSIWISHKLNKLLAKTKWKSLVLQSVITYSFHEKNSERLLRLSMDISNYYSTLKTDCLKNLRFSLPRKSKFEGFFL